MRSMTVSCLVAAICSITAAASEASVASSVANVLTESPAVPTPLTDKVETEDEVHAELELRQATGIVTGATQAALQYPSVTVQFLQTVVPGGATTYLPFTYTQTFASFPDNWATIPIPAGQIGYGTLTKGKRDAEPTAAIFVIPIEMVLQTMSVVEPIFQVLPINVTQPLLSHHISFVNATDVLSSENTYHPLSSVAAIQGISQPQGSQASLTLSPAIQNVQGSFSPHAANYSSWSLASIGLGTGTVLSYGTAARSMNRTGYMNGTGLFTQPISFRNTSIDVRLLMTAVARPTTANDSLVNR